MRCYLLCLFVLFSLAAAAQPHTVELTADRSSAIVGQAVQVLDAGPSEIPLEDALRATAWKDRNEAVPNLGVSDHVYWLRFRVHNEQNEAALLLQFAQPEIERLEVHVVDRDSIGPVMRAGQLFPLSPGAYDDYDYVFRFDVPQGAYRDIYIRTSSTKQLQLPIEIGTADPLAVKRSSRDVIMGIYFGVMLVLLFYNLFIYVSTRDKSYGIYVIYISFVALTQAVFMGLARYYLWPTNGWFAMHATVILTVTTAIIAMEFMHAFVHTHHIVPSSSRWTRVFYVLLLAGMLVRLFVDARVGYRMLQPITALAAVYQLAVAIVAYRRGSRPAGFFLLAWTIFLLGIVAYILKDVGLLPYSNLTRYTMTLGSAMEGVLLSFGLADRINTLRKEKERSQAEALLMAQENERIIHDQNVMLERKVVERTQALQESNDHLKRTQSQLVSAEKMASLGQLTAGIAHEINNPVNFISSNIPPLKRDLVELRMILQKYRDAAAGNVPMADVEAMERSIDVDENVREVEDILKSMEEGAARTSAIVRGLRTFSRLDEDDLKPADVNEGLRSTLVVLGSQYRDQVEVVLDLDELPKVECYPGKLNQVFMNMLNNAVHAAKARHGDSGGQVHVHSHATGDFVVVSIRDNGIGMEQTVRDRVFEPFFTTKDVGEGTGLGLSIAHSIIEKHGGRIELDTTPGSGTEFRVVLPVEQQRNVKRA